MGVSVTERIGGGCLCGDIRYAISGDAQLQLFYFCAACRRRSGTDGYAGYMVKDEVFSVLQGTASVYERSSEAGRTVQLHFCGRCGSNLWGATELGLTRVAAGSLDDPELFQPDRAVFLNEAATWARVPEGMA